MKVAPQIFVYICDTLMCGEGAGTIAHHSHCQGYLSLLLLAGVHARTRDVLCQLPSGVASHHSAVKHKAGEYSERRVRWSRCVCVCVCVCVFNVIP